MNHNWSISSLQIAHVINNHYNLHRVYNNAVKPFKFGSVIVEPTGPGLFWTVFVHQVKVRSFLGTSLCFLTPYYVVAPLLFNSREMTAIIKQLICSNFSLHNGILLYWTRFNDVFSVDCKVWILKFSDGYFMTHWNRVLQVQKLYKQNSIVFDLLFSFEINIFLPHWISTLNKPLVTVSISLLQGMFTITVCNWHQKLKGKHKALNENETTLTRRVRCRSRKWQFVHDASGNVSDGLTIKLTACLARRSVDWPCVWLCSWWDAAWIAMCVKQIDNEKNMRLFVHLKYW